MVWYALQYKPTQGDRAVDHLQNQGVVCFYPKILSRKISKGRRAERLEPLFPGYLFVQLDLDDPLWSRIRSTRGVARVVSFGGKPARVDAEIINRIRVQLKLYDAETGIQPGERVRIAKGPLAGLEAIFEMFDGDERAIVLLNMLQKTQRINIELEALI